jgi:hypothetical protein
MFLKRFVFLFLIASSAHAKILQSKGSVGDIQHLHDLDTTVNGDVIN